MLTRPQVMRYRCPTCAAEPNQACRRINEEAEGTRYQFHHERRTYARLHFRRRALAKELAEVDEEIASLTSCLNAQQALRLQKDPR